MVRGTLNQKIALGIEKERNDAADNLTKQGAIQKTIASALGLRTRQAGYSYLQRTGQHLTWKSASRTRREKYKKQKAQEKIIETLEEMIIKKALNSSEAYQKAATYKRLFPHTTYDFSTLVRLFDVYCEAREKQEKLSYRKISEKTGLVFSEVGRVLHRVGLSSMNKYENPRKRISSRQSIWITRGFESQLSASDVAYFLGMPPYVVRQRYNKLRKARKSERHFSRFQCKVKTITAHQASLIYEADDHQIGFSNHELSALINEDEDAIQWIHAQRLYIEPIIVNSLKTIFNDSSLTRPYLPSEYLLQKQFSQDSLSNP